MGLKSWVLVIGVVGSISLIGANSGVWNLSNSIVNNDSGVIISDKKRGLIATEFYQKVAPPTGMSGWKTTFWFKVTNNMNNDVHILVNFEKGEGPGQDDGEGKGAGYDIVDPDPVTITRNSFVEFPVVVNAGNWGNSNPLSVNATVLAQWTSGSAVIRDELTGSDKK